jgi:UDP-3-O-[3-hydroxymyristoyl] glucosamine N-acyltransferase
LNPNSNLTFAFQKNHFMKLPYPIPVRSLAETIGATILGGDEMLFVRGINEIHKAENGDLIFCDLPKYFQKSLQSAATFVLLNENVAVPDGKVLLCHPKPFDAYNRLIQKYRPFEPLNATNHGISASAVIHPSVIIEPGVVIGNHVKIDAGTYIRANAFIDDYTIIGKNVVIGAGALIGTDAFCYKKHPPTVEKRYEKWRSGGRVILEANTDIGAGCTINKGVSGDTIIGAGTKLDCQVHIGHGVVVGKNCLFAAQVGVSGKVTIEDDVILYGQVGVAQNVRIGKGATILAKSGVAKSVEGGKTYFGVPAREAKETLREMVTLKQLTAKKN